MLTRTHQLFKALTLCLFLTLLTTPGVLGWTQHNTDAKLPKGKWTLTTYPDYSASPDAPVIVNSVTSDASRGLAVTKVGLLNRTSKSISGVKLTWSLSAEESPKEILLQGETPIIELGNTLQSRGRRKLDFSTTPVVSFGKIHKTFIKRGMLAGNFRIDVVASEVVYEDGSTWKRSDVADVALRGTYRKVSHATVEEGFCPQTKM